MKHFSLLTNLFPVPIRRIGSRHLVALVLLAGPMATNAEVLPLFGGPVASELPHLPPFCNEATRQQYMNRVYGRDISGLQHYCWGLNNMNRYYRRAPGYAPGTWLANAIEGFDYVLANPPLDHPLVPEMFLNRAVALSLKGDDGGAARDYTRAIQLNPSLAKAYLALSDSYFRRGLKSQALETVTQGLRYLPSNTLLQQDYAKYGGKLPYPEPIAKPAKNPEEEKVPHAGEEALKQVREGGKPAAPTQPPQEQSSSPGATSLAEHATNGEQASAVGDTPKKKSCRFCVDLPAEETAERLPGAAPPKRNCRFCVD